MRQKIACNILRKILLCLLFLSSWNYSWAQTKQYATQSYSANNVVDEVNAVDGNETTKATLESRELSLLPPLSKLNGKLGLRFVTPVSASKKAYIKVGVDDASVLQGLLGGSLGGALTGLLDNLVLGSHKYEVSLFNSGSLVTSDNSSNNFAGGAFRIMQVGDGNFLFEIDVNASFNEIVIDTRSDAVLPLVGTGKRKFDVYDAFYYDSLEGGCGRPFGTSFDGSSGLNLSLLNLSDQHLNRAIDDDPDSYAVLNNSSLLGLSVATTLSQYFYFPTESDETATVNVKLGMNSSGLLDLDLLGATEIVFYSGADEVHKRSLKSSLLHNTNALGLLDDGDPVTLTFAPGREFDRIEFRLNSPVGLNLLNAAFRIYDVQRYSGDPGCENPLVSVPAATADPFDEASCAASLIDFDNVDFAHNAVDNNNESFATLYADAGSLLVSGPTAGFIEMDLGTTVPANKTTYVRIDYDEDVLNALLGGSLGGMLADVANGLLLGDQFFEIEAKSGTNIVLESSSANAFSSTTNSGIVTLVQDNIGRTYIAITPNEAYDGVRITNRVVALLPTGKKASLDVYDACFEIGTGLCFPPNFTSFDGGNGLSLDVLSGLEDQNLNRAIDDDENSYSLLKTTVAVGVNVLGSFSQNFYFSTISSEGSTVNMKLALGSGGAINTDLLGGIEVVFYKGADIIYRRSLQSSLLNNTDVLTLLQSGNAATLIFAPSREFDRMEVRLSSTAGLNVLGNGVRIYDVQRYDGVNCMNPLVSVPAATADPFDEASCAASLIDFDNVDFAHNAVDGNNESFATLYADAGSLLVSGPTAGFIEMDLGTTVPANKTTYVRINYDEDVLDALLGGSLGQLVADLTNNLLLGNQYFEVEAKNGSTTVLNESSDDAFEGNANGIVTLVQDNIGRTYIAITPNAAYNRIRITNHVVALLPTGKKASLDVYDACFDIGTDVCFPANFTSYKGGGLNLSLADLASVGVENPYRAISANSSEYSTINLGIAGVAANVYQTIYFNQPSQLNDKVKIRLQIEPSSLLSLDVLGRYKIRFYNGNTQVGPDYTLQDGLINNIDLLGLFNSGGIAELEFEPTGIFDRVDIGAETLVSATVATEPLRVYSVTRYGDTCPEPFEDSPFEEPECATELIEAKNADDIQNLFDGNNATFATLNSGAGTLLGLGNKFEGFVELGYDHDVPAGTTSYIRIDFEETILEKLVGGSLGNVVTGLLDGLILGDHYFEVDVKYNGISVDAANSKDASAGGNNAIRVVQDKAGRYYIAVTPADDYNSVRITDRTDSALGLLAQPNTMNVYGMCYETSADQCLDAFATSYEYTGIALTVTDLSGAGVTNPQWALDDNSTHGSTISMGTLNLLGGVKQWIFFNTTSTADDVVNVRLRIGTGAVDLSLLGDLKIIAYLGNTPVATMNWNTNGLINTVNVINQLNNGEIVDVPFAPGAEYDRISVGIENLISASVLPPVVLYSVERCYDLAVLPRNCIISNPMLTNKIKK